MDEISADARRPAMDEPVGVAVPLDPVMFQRQRQANKRPLRRFWQEMREHWARQRANPIPFDMMSCEEGRAIVAMKEAIDALPVAMQLRQRFKLRYICRRFRRLLILSPGDISETGMLLDFEDCRPCSKKYHVDAVAALRAGKSDWDTALIAGLHASYRDNFPWLRRRSPSARSVE